VRAESPDVLEVAGFGQDEADVRRIRFQDDGGDLPRVGLECGFEAAASLNGRTIVSCAKAAGTPALSGWPWVSAPEPALIRSESECPW